MKILPLLLYFLIVVNSFAIAQNSIFTKEQLIQDTRELMNLIEKTHPDPYIEGGGKIKLHRMFQAVLKAFPDSGMTMEEFVWLLQPMVNSIGDGHTTVRNPFFKFDPQAKNGMPFWFSIYSDKGLYISKVARKEFESLIGSKLISAEGFTIPELLVKTRRLFPSQNDYDCLWNLNAMLWESYFLQRFLPDCAEKNLINIEIELPDGKRKKLEIDLSLEREYPLIQKQTLLLDLPSASKYGFTYEFLSPDKLTAFLRIDSQEGFREIVEYAIFHQFENDIIRQFADPIYERINSGKAPGSIDSLLDGIPSATEFFKTLFDEMKDAQTENLIIDLSRNQGGQSILSQILIYFLCGTDKLIELQRSYSEIDKYSNHYFDVFTMENLNQINDQRVKQHSFKLDINDYNFDIEEERNLILSGKISKDSLLEKLHKEFKPYTTFYKDFKDRAHDSYYKPKNVFVICSERTYSAGFGTLVDLFKCDAVIIGNPSGQSANCFGNAVYFELSNTKTNGFVSTKYIEMLPDNPQMGKVLFPQYPLTYEILKKYEFDTNTVFRYAMDLVSR